MDRPQTSGVRETEDSVLDDLPRPLPSPGEWHRHGLCRWMKGNFFPRRGEPANEARHICEACAVRVECESYATVNFIRHGIWGGRSFDERRSIRRTVGVRGPRRPSRVVVPAECCPRCRGIRYVVVDAPGRWLCLDCKIRWSVTRAG